MRAVSEDGPEHFLGAQVVLANLQAIWCHSNRMDVVMHSI